MTPDSFSDGGRYLDRGAAIEHGRELVAQGAHIVDIGGESTRPGATPVAAEEELGRVLPVIAGLAGEPVQVAIDTRKASVAAAALAAGASLVNDVSALRDPEMAAVIASAGCECCLMHMRGEPASMQEDPRYGDVVADVRAFLEERLAFAVGAGIQEERILLDPGIGFGKTDAHNLELLARLDELAAIGPPIVIGTSRKGFLGRLIAVPGAPAPAPEARLAATIASNVLALERGARVFRVHDVAAHRDALRVAAATLARKWMRNSTGTLTT